MRYVTKNEDVHADFQDISIKGGVRIQARDGEAAAPSRDPARPTAFSRRVYERQVGFYLPLPSQPSSSRTLVGQHPAPRPHNPVPPTLVTTVGQGPLRG